jgi:hypothetical protein
MNTLVTLCVGVAAALALPGCATQHQLDVTNTHLSSIEAQLSIQNQIGTQQLQQAFANPFLREACLLAGQPYSEGAVAAVRVCTRAPVSVGQPRLMGQPRLLQWQPESSTRAYP